jgi:hypothetical protein
LKFFDKFEFIEDFFSDNPLYFLAFLFLFFLLSFLMIVILGFIYSKKDKILNEEIPKKVLTFDDLIKIVKNSNSTNSDLIFALKYFNDNFKVKDFPSKSFDFFRLLLSHKSRDKKIFQIFHNETIKLNAEFEKQLNEIERECLK